MELRVQRAAVTEIDTPLLVVNLFEGVTRPDGATNVVDQALGGQITRLIADGEISGEPATITVIHRPTGGEAGLRAQRVAVVGLGKSDAPELDRLEQVRIAAATAARKARDLKLDSFATIIHGAGLGGLALADAARATLESSILALYRYEQFKEATKSKHAVSTMTVVDHDADRISQLEQAAELATRTCAAVMKVRDLSVGPGNFVTPTYLADAARAVAEAHGLDILVWGKDELRAHGMNAILAVNAGSSEPPAFVAMTYTAPGATRTLAVVGKGITFDSGGISIKPADSMEYMRHDMTGAATVIGFMQLAAATQVPVNILGIFAATENLPSGSSYKPGDVFTAYNGKTMEIVNTDAEGRVILSDSLAYAAEQKPDAIIDFATLTGACQIALGDHATGLMTNTQALADQVLAAGEISGDRCWQLPMWKVYGEQIKTAMADMRNTGGRRAGAITAGLFLQEFVGDVPWVHLDIAGTAYADGEQTYVAPYNPKPGATGVGVRLLWHFCQAWKDAQPIATDPARRLALNTAAPMAARIVDAAFAIVYFRLLGRMDVGAYAFIVVFTTYLDTLIDFGLNALVAREVARGNVDGAAAFRSVNRLRVGLWFVGLPIVALVYGPLQETAGLPDEAVAAGWIFYIALLPSVLAKTSTGVLWAAERLDLTAAVSVGGTIVRTALGVVVLFAGLGLVGLAASSLVINIASGLILWRLAVSRIRTPAGAARPHPLRWMRESWPLFINQLLQGFFFKIDSILLPGLAGVAAAGVYAAAYKVAEGAGIVSSSFTLALFPRLSREHDVSGAYRLALRTLLQIALPLAAGIAILSEPVVTVVAGRDYLPDSAIALSILICYLPLSYANGLTQYVLIAAGRQRLLTAAFIAALIFNLAANFALIPRFSYVGAAWVTVLSEVVLLVPFQLAARRVAPGVSLLREVRPALLATLLMAPAAWWLRDAIHPLAAILGGGAVYLLAIWTVGGVDDQQLRLLRQLRRAT